MNSVQIVGVILQIKRPSETATSGRVVVRFGPLRKARKNTDRQFVNAVEVRVPERNVDQIESLEPGMLVEILARLQGIHQSSQMGPSAMYTEVVASRIVPFELKEAIVQDVHETLPSNGDSDDSEDDDA